MHEKSGNHRHDVWFLSIYSGLQIFIIRKGFFFSVQPVDASCNVKYLVLLHVYDP